MIGRLNGCLIEKNPPEILLDVQGIGYEILVPMTTFYLLPEKNQACLLFTHFVVREDVQQLYGFMHLRDRSLFRQLLKVNGIGPKIGLAILSSMEADDIVRAVLSDDIQVLSGVPGIGKKTAERMIIELRDKLAGWKYNSNINNCYSARFSQSILVTTESAIKDEAISALVALGFKSTEAQKTIQQCLKIAPDLTKSTELIRAALQRLAKS